MIISELRLKCILDTLLGYFVLINMKRRNIRGNRKVLLTNKPQEPPPLSGFFTSDQPSLKYF